MAIIMDGNGRWAKVHGRERTFGHLRGARVAKTMIEHCADLGVRHLTLYAFSTENWLRPKPEVFFLMRLLARHMRKERDNLVKNNIRFTTIGELQRLPHAVQAEVRKTEAATAANTGMHLVFALSYGARQEITAAVRALAQEVAEGRLKPEAINETLVQNRLETSDMPDPDLIIRTSGEYRLSNFLLWQAAYSELYITNTLWPDFTIQELEHALQSYSQRERRFGRTHASLPQGSVSDESDWVDPSLDDFDSELDTDLNGDSDAAFPTESVLKAAPIG
ncbi:MAG: isoprenyl transferase [Bdellovibrionaceae bacterium]|nr:isoprenyl transferase [Pseudobdellovibrionaceae bacterium]